MTESGRKTCRKIQATQHWLNKAEKHFDQNASSRGELDLLLAEAELRSTRESLPASSGGLRWLWLQHGMAFGIALALVTVGLSGAWLWWRELPVMPATLPVVMSPAASAPVLEEPGQPVISAVPVQAKEETPAATTAVTVVPTNPRQEVNSSDKPATQETPVSPDEMKRLVRTAGKSLRGQPKQ